MSDCDCIHEGDWVESKLNDDVFGIVIGFSGAHLQVQLAGSLKIETFHEATLRRLDDNDRYPGGIEDAPDNVIDFTKAAASLKNAKTYGVA